MAAAIFALTWSAVSDGNGADDAIAPVIRGGINTEEVLLVLLLSALVRALSVRFVCWECDSSGDDCLAVLDDKPTAWTRLLLTALMLLLLLLLLLLTLAPAELAVVVLASFLGVLDGFSCFGTVPRAYLESFLAAMWASNALFINFSVMMAWK